MTTDPAQRLADVCGGDLPSGLARLDPAHQQQLVEAIEAAQQRQATALVESTDRGLQLMPKVLRRAVTKVLFG